MANKRLKHVKKNVQKFTFRPRNLTAEMLRLHQNITCSINNSNSYGLHNRHESADCDAEKNSFLFQL